MGFGVEQLCLEAQFCLNRRLVHLLLPSSTLVREQWHEAFGWFLGSVVGMYCLEGCLIESNIVKGTSSPHGTPRPATSAPLLKILKPSSDLLSLIQELETCALPSLVTSKWLVLLFSFLSFQIIYLLCFLIILPKTQCSKRYDLKPTVSSSF